MASAADEVPVSPETAAPPLDGLSTGVKMLLILTAALLPLGLIALLASIQSAHAKQLQRRQDAHVAAVAEARQIDILLLRSMNIIRSRLAGASSSISPTGDQCARSRIPDPTGFRGVVRFALFEADGRRRCASAGYTPGALRAPTDPIGMDMTLLPGTGGLRVSVRGGGGSYGVAEVPLTTLRSVLPADDDQGIVLVKDGQRLVIATAEHPRLGGEWVTVRAPISSSQGYLELTTAISRISAVEVLLVLLPLLMWVAAAGIAFVVLDQLLLRPLAQLQRAITAFHTDEGALVLPRLLTPAKEIRSLGDAFAQTTTQLARREAQLEQGLSHQVRLTREVHHRVKNNLQVVASLINLHSRGTQGEVQAAYASIQRRVDALAVVHRNHYAELEENRGVALRSIIAELTANLRGNAPPAASHFTIALDMMPAFITQDVAVPVAFLVTEIVELVMTCDPTGAVAIALTPGATEDRAILSIEARGMTAEGCKSHPDRAGFERIVTGLSRQLRAQLDYDPTLGRYQIAIAILPQRADEKKS